MWWEVSGVLVSSPRGTGDTHTLTLCLPMTKEICLLHGLTKLDQLVSSVTYSPFRARNRMGEQSKGCPPDCTTRRAKTEFRERRDSTGVRGTRKDTWRCT